MLQRRTLEAKTTNRSVRQTDRRPRRSLRRPIAATAATAVASIGLLALDVASPGTAHASFSCDSGVAYTVESGDSWWSIANELDVALSALLARNDAGAPDLLVPGDRLCLPHGADTSPVCDNETVRPGDGWIAIATRVGVSLSGLLDANGVDVDRLLHPGMELCVPAGGQSTRGSDTSTSTPRSPSTEGPSYTARPGDSWYRIANRAGVTLRSLLASNDAAASEVLLVGRRVTLPAGAQPPQPAGPAYVALDAAPVQGHCSYADTWGAPRHGGRSHQGVDIFTAPRAYVYAMTDGRLTARRWAGASTAAGNAWTLTADDGTRFFYAHLYDFNPELRVGSRVEAGEILGWVGGTGNASAPHLHLEVRPQGGPVVNPYPILREQGACNTGRPYRQPSGWIPD